MPAPPRWRSAALAPRGGRPAPGPIARWRTPPSSRPAARLSLRAALRCAHASRIAEPAPARPASLRYKAHFFLERAGRMRESNARHAGRPRAAPAPPARRYAESRGAVNAARARAEEGARARRQLRALGEESRRVFKRARLAARYSRLAVFEAMSPERGEESQAWVEAQPPRVLSWLAGPRAELLLLGASRRAERWQATGELAGTCRLKPELDLRSLPGGSTSAACQAAAAARTCSRERARPVSPPTRGVGEGRILKNLVT